MLFLAFFLLAALDLVGISLVGPLVLVFFDFNKVQNEWGWFPGYEQQELAVLATTVIVIVFSLRTICIWAMNSLILNATFDRQIELRAEIVSRALNQNYSKRLTKNTAHYNTVLFSHCQAFVQASINILRISAEGLSVIFIMMLLIYTDIHLFLVALTFSLGAISTMLFLFSRKFVAYGIDKNKGLIKFTTAVHEAIYGIKEIKVLSLIDFFRARVIDGATRAATAEKKLYLFSIVPRYIVETVLVTIICLILVFSIYANDDIIDTVGVLSVFLVASLRLLPSISLIIGAVNDLSLGTDGINKLFDELYFDNSSMQDTTLGNFSKPKDSFESLEFSDISFHYLGESNEEIEIFKQINFSIDAGDFIGLVGDSGSGKTTLIDLILGINMAQSGSINRNGLSIQSNLQAWRSEIAYLPQETFILNGTVAENIAIGLELEDIDITAVEQAIRKAGLSPVMNDLPDGLHTQVGERGLKFSGGQRQRIALARAFFAERNIFLFDESTSALDTESAESILNELSILHKQGCTVILISHNHDMLWRCSKTLSIKNGTISNL